MNDLLVSSEEQDDFLNMEKNYDKNQSMILDKDDDWYYNDTSHISNTHLGKLLNGGPQHLKAYFKGTQKETPALIFGRAQHCLLLEPDLFDSRFYAIDDTEICKEIGGKVPRNTNAYREWIGSIREENANRQELSLQDITDIKNMIDKAMSYKQIRELVESAYKKETIYTNTIKQIKCKCKVDGINPSNFIIDYKSTKEPATLYNWLKIKKKYKYDRQASFYKDITKVKSFWFIVQEKTYPYTICLVEQSEDSYIKGCEEYEIGLDMYKRHFIENPGGIDQYLEMGII